MTAYTGKLPEDFEWVIQEDSGDAAAAATLVLGDHELAVVKPMGRAWVAVVNPTYSPGGYPACIVPNRPKGQAWIAKWLRRSLIGIKSACDRERPVVARKTSSGRG